MFLKINLVFKELIFKPIYKLTHKETLPVLGLGKRPAGAKDCSLSGTNELSQSFGMPSGHSQIAWTMGTYLICRLINRFADNLNKNEASSTATIILDNIWIFISILVILAAMIYISYSRVYIEGCHTIQQVSVGGVVGALLGFLAFYFEADIRRGLGY